MKTILFFVLLLTTNVISARTTQWKHFKHKYGFSIDLPNSFQVAGLTNSGIQYYQTYIDENIILAVETNGVGNKGLLQNDYTSLLDSHSSASLKLIKDNWFVISGEQGGEIYYYKEYFKNNQTYMLTITYPPRHRLYFDAVLGRIAKSFK